MTAAATRIAVLDLSSDIQWGYYGEYRAKVKLYKMSIPALVNVNVEVDKVLAAVWDKCLSIIGQDKASTEFKKWLEERTRNAFQVAKYVQCVGMQKPLPISEIYQPTRLRVIPNQQKRAFHAETRDWVLPAPEYVLVDKFLGDQEDSVITAGPGWGKTTFLHAVFVKMLCSEKVLPILFTLRQQEALPDLERFVSSLDGVQKQNQSRRFLLLVDGYDEVPPEARKRVSSLLIKFRARDVGLFYLTCRTHYDIYDLAARHVSIAEFSREDQIRFADGFFRAYGATADPTRTVDDLQQRGLGDLLKHPLLLALACIVRSASEIPSRNVRSLIEIAIQTLSFRWDQSKGVLSRERTTPLDGNSHVKCLKRLAFNLPLEPTHENRVLHVTRAQLDKMRWENVNPTEVLLEMARFYGIFVPVENKWGFVHRTLQDYLAAQEWVETGAFAAALQKPSLRLDSRAAYAACQLSDATEVMEKALREQDGVTAFVDMLINDASFDNDRIASAIINYYQHYKGEHYFRLADNRIECHLDQEFISYASSKFLDHIIYRCASARGKTADTIAAYALKEIVRRGGTLTRKTYDGCCKGYKSETVAFLVLGEGGGNFVRLGDVPHLE